MTADRAERFKSHWNPHDLDLASMRTMRQSTMSRAQTCLYQLGLHLENPRWTASVNSAIGTGYHAGVALRYEGHRDGFQHTWEACVNEGIRAFFEEVEGAIDGFDWTFQAQTSRMKEWVMTPDEAKYMVKGAILTHKPHEWDPERYQVIAVEKSFARPGRRENWADTGTVDLALWDMKSGRHILVDHKTSKRKWRADKHLKTSQPNHYIDCWADLLGVPPDQVSFAFDVVGLLDGTFERRTVSRTAEQLEATRQYADSLIDLIEQGGPFLPNTDSFLCHPTYCNYWDDCPFGKAKGTHK